MLASGLEPGDEAAVGVHLILEAPDDVATLIELDPLGVLDEATSALDNASERAVQEALSALMQGRTTLVIAHRLSTIQDADLILVLDQGQIRHAGSHAALLEASPIYREMQQLAFTVG